MPRYQIKIVPLTPQRQEISPVTDVKIHMSIDHEQITVMNDMRIGCHTPDQVETLLAGLTPNQRVLHYANSINYFFTLLANGFNANIYYREENATLWSKYEPGARP